MYKRLAKIPFSPNPFSLSNRNPTYVVAMGARAISRGLYFGSYNVLPGVDNNMLPADVYFPSCLPGPKTLIQAIMLLQEKIKRSTLKKV